MESEDAAEWAAMGRYAFLAFQEGEGGGEYPRAVLEKRRRPRAARLVRLVVDAVGPEHAHAPVLVAVVGEVRLLFHELMELRHLRHLTHEGEALGADLLPVLFEEPVLREIALPVEDGRRIQVTVVEATHHA